MSSLKEITNPKPIRKLSSVRSTDPELFRRILTVSLLGLIVLVCFSIPNPTAHQWKIMNGLTAITLAFLASEITGFFNLSIPKFVKAGGAIAVFAFVFWTNKDYTISEIAIESTTINQVEDGVNLISVD